MDALIEGGQGGQAKTPNDLAIGRLRSSPNLESSSPRRPKDLAGIYEGGQRRPKAAKAAKPSPFPGEPTACPSEQTTITSGGQKRERANLQSLCRICHQEKTNKEKLGLRWIPPKHRGCDADGYPLDPNDAWSIERRRELH